MTFLPFLKGAEGFFIAQYGTIFKMSFVFAIGIMLVYFTRSSTGGTDLASLGVGNYLMAIF